MKKYIKPQMNVVLFTMHNPLMAGSVIGENVYGTENAGEGVSGLGREFDFDDEEEY